MILAQDERWRRILGMQVERSLSVGQEIFNLTIFNLQSSTNFQFSNIENWKIHCKLRFENWNFSPCGRGVVGPQYGTAEDRRIRWKAEPKKVIALYLKSKAALEAMKQNKVRFMAVNPTWFTGPEYHRRRQTPVGSWGDHAPRLNTQEYR